MLGNFRNGELVVTAGIVALCLAGGFHCLFFEQLINALGFLIAALAIPMIFWYMNRIAKANEARTADQQAQHTEVMNKLEELRIADPLSDERNPPSVFAPPGAR